MATGRSYVSDGFAHALDFQVNGKKPGMSDVAIDEAGTVNLQTKISFAPETPQAVAQGTIISEIGRRALGDTVTFLGPPPSSSETGGTRKIEVVVNGIPVASQTVNTDGNKGTYTHDLFTEFALDFVKRHKDDPFFLYLPYTVPHSAYEIPDTAPYTDRAWTDDEKVHAAMITRLDRDVGSLFQLLKGLKLDENTIVFFCSDNGAAERWEGRFDSSGDLRGRKRDMYEGGIRTPMIVRWPGKVAVGTSNNTAWYFADVLPTVAVLAGANVPASIDGISVLPSILGDSQDLSDRTLYWEFFESGFQQAVRQDDWKAVRLILGEPLELYDLSKDEEHNVAAQHPEVVANFEAYLITARSASRNWPVEELD
jgi:arylsulfatase A-like enzyme